MSFSRLVASRPIADSRFLKQAQVSHQALHRQDGLPPHTFFSFFLSSAPANSQVSCHRHRLLPPSQVSAFSFVCFSPPSLTSLSYRRVGAAWKKTLQDVKELRAVAYPAVRGRPFPSLE